MQNRQSRPTPKNRPLAAILAADPELSLLVAKQLEANAVQGSRLPPHDRAALDAAMGLSAAHDQVINTPHKLVLGAPRAR